VGDSSPYHIVLVFNQVTQVNLLKADELLADLDLCSLFNG